MAQDSPLDLATAYQDAWLSGDFAKARGFIAEDIVFQSPQRRITG